MKKRSVSANERRRNRIAGGLLVGSAVVLTGVSLALSGCSLPQAQGRQDKPAVKLVGGDISGPILLTESVTVRRTQTSTQVSISGQVEPYAVATVAAEVAARVIARPVERGDRVAEGDTLAVLDAATARAERDRAVAASAQATAARRQLEQDYARATVETAAIEDQAREQVTQTVAAEKKTRFFTREQELHQAEAALSQAKTDEALAKLEADRYSRLVADGAVAQQVLDRAQATYDAAKARTISAEEAVSLAHEGARTEDIAQAAAQTQAARASYRSAQTRPARLAALREQIAALRAQEAQAQTAIRSAQIALEKHRIHAPFPGRILETRIEAGEMASPGAPVAKLGDLRRVKVVFAVPEAARQSLREGQVATVTVDTLPGRAFTGRVTVLGFEADSRARTFPLEVTLANSEEKLLPGMVARLRLDSGSAHSQMSVPVESVATSEGDAFVYVLGSDGRTKRRPVTLGAPLPNGQVQVVSGLSGTERIARTPQRLTEGVLVRITERGAR